MDARLSWMTLGGSILLLMAGCGDSTPEEISDLSPRPRSASMTESPSYLAGSEAARDAMSSVPAKLRQHSTFGPTQKKVIISALSASESKLEKSLQGAWVRRYEAPPIDQVSEEAQGWNWLARSLDWQAQEALSQQNWPLAAHKSIRAIQFGLRWTTGDCFEAVGGLEVAETHALRLAPFIPQMGPRTLEAVAGGTALALKGLANPEVTLQNEQDRIAVTMQALQSACREKGYKGMLPLVGPSSHDGAEWVGKNRKKLGWFFKSFLEECDRLSAEYVDFSLGSKPFDSDIFDSRADRWDGVLRPWRDMTPQIMAGHEAYRKARQGVVTRLRLLAATCAIEAKLKREGRVPKDLSFLPEDLRKDPYRDGDLAYRPGEVTYRLWSVGPNGVDDGGLVDPGAVVLDQGLNSPLGE